MVSGPVDQAHFFAVLERQGPIAVVFDFGEPSPAGSSLTGRAFIGSMKEKLTYFIHPHMFDARIRANGTVIA